MAGTDPGGGSTRSLLGTVASILAAVALVVAATVVPALSIGEVPEAADVGSRVATPPGGGSGAGMTGAGGSGAGGTGAAGGSGASSRAGVGSGVPGGIVGVRDATRVGENLSGALKNQSDARLFVVESERPSYWRTGAYDRYTGEGWARSEQARRTTPYDGPLASGGRTFRQVVTLERPARALPAAWRPRSLSDNVADDALVTEQGAIRGRDAYPAGTSYIVTSVARPRDPATLREAGTDYPPAVEDRYTRLPDDVPDRLHERAAAIAAGADSPYARAVAIEEWLEANKAYSLNASYRGEHVADHFVFEMERGYCELFATAMVAMLRSQGVPARYVVGYSTGEPVDEDTYAVRRMNAHAWVEVYFPDVGWVRFDPTPGSARLAREAASLQQGAAGNGTGTATPDGSGGPPSYDHTEYGSPGEAFNRSGEVEADEPGEARPTEAAASGGGLAVSGEVGASRSALRNQSAEALFVVESGRPSYWRTGAYDRYTGGGWARSDAAARTRAYDGPLAGGDPRVRQVVTVRTPTRTLPAAWRPRSLSDNVAGDALVTGLGGLRSERPLDAGESYTVVSVPPTRDPSALRDAGTDYPAAIRDRYTRLPADTPDRLAGKAREVTAGAETPYGAAAAIEEWLEANKAYSLNASYRGEHVADHFVFEMDAGYCAMFATAMVAMLRSQGVPARYAVGYSTGEPVAAGTYEVRAMNAHAWVEVYFPGVGWVRFDPTPGGARLAREAGAVSEQTGRDAGAYDHTEYGSPGEQFNSSGPLDESQQDDQQNGTRQDDQQDQQTQSLNHTLESQPVPGKTVVVTVTRAGRPVEGAQVLFDGEAVGLTNASGQAAVEVPYVGQINVSVRAPSSVGGAVGAVGPMGGVAPGAAAMGAGRAAPNNSTSYVLPTRINVEANGSGKLVPGTRATLTATIQGVPVPDAVVRVDGDVVGRTNATGRITVAVPWTEAIRVVVRRGETRGNESLAVATDVDLQVTNAVPGRTAAGVATIAGRPLAGRPVSVDGDVVGRTGEDGQFAFEVPFEAAVTVTVSRGAARGERTIDLPTNATVEVVGTPVPGERVAVVATLEGSPLPAAAVELEGERVGRTDERGVLNVTMPYADPAAVVVRRGAVRGNGSADPPPMNLSVSPAAGPVLAAGLPASVTVTIAGRPVPGATVTAGGAGTTGADGTADVSLPLGDEAEISASRGGLTATTTRSGLLYPWLALVGLAAAVAAAVRTKRRHGLSLRELLARARHAALRVAHLTAAALVVAARRLDRALQELARGLHAAARFLAARLRALGARLRDVLAALPSPDELDEWLLERYARLRAWLSRTVSPAGDGLAGPTAEGAVAGPDEEALADERLAVREAWAEMVAHLPVRRYGTRTPGELARMAIDRGFPAGPVAELTDAFREVEYGRYEPTEGRLGRVRSALERVRAYLGRDDGDEGGDRADRAGHDEGGGAA